MTAMFIALCLALSAVVALGSYWLNCRDMQRLEQLGQPDTALVEIPRPETDDFREAIRKIDGWAHGHGFKPWKLLKMQAGGETTWIATWRYPARERLFLLYHSGNRNHFELVTCFAGSERSLLLSTGNDKNTHAFPLPPDMLAQNFSYFGPDMLLGEHIAGEAYIEEKYALGRQPLAENIKDELAGRFRSQLDFVRSLPYWQLKSPYWLLFRRHFKANTPVRSLY